MPKRALCMIDFKARHYSAKKKKKKKNNNRKTHTQQLCFNIISTFSGLVISSLLKILTNAEFCNFHHPLPWKPSKMAAKQKKLFAVCIKGCHKVELDRCILNDDIQYTSCDFHSNSSDRVQRVCCLLYTPIAYYQLLLIPSEVG